MLQTAANVTAYIEYQGQEKNKCGSGYPTYSKFLPPTVNFFLQILKLEENSRTINIILFCYSLPTSEF